MGKKAAALKRQKKVDTQQDDSDRVASVLLMDEKPKKKWHNMWIRTLYTLLMIAGFFLVLASGYIWSIVGVLIITVMVYNEVVQIACLGAQEQSIRWFKTMSW
jgi:phosphatidate cytidylyltransferase